MKRSRLLILPVAALLSLNFVACNQSSPKEPPNIQGVWVADMETLREDHQDELDSYMGRFALQVLGGISVEIDSDTIIFKMLGEANSVRYRVVRVGDDAIVIETMDKENVYSERLNVKIVDEGRIRLEDPNGEKPAVTLVKG